MACALPCLVAMLAFSGITRASTQCAPSSLQVNANSAIDEAGQRYVKVEIRGHTQEMNTVGVSVAHWSAECGNVQVMQFQLNASCPAGSINPSSTTTEIAETYPTTTDAPTCRPGYSLIPSFGCYKWNITQVTWDQAQQACELDGGHLAVPDSQPELFELGKIWTSDLQVLCPWVGIQGSNNSWVTVEGRPFTLDWDTEDPIPANGCAVVYPDRLSSWPCYLTRTFICEQNHH